MELCKRRLQVNKISTLVSNISGQVRRETLHDKEYLVAPLSMIVPGVLPGNKGPLLYSEDEVAKNPNVWNNIPIVVNHPMKDGMPIEARSPDILERYQIGTVFNSKYDGRLVAEGWFDVERTRKTNIGIYDQLVSNKPMELSTGLYTDNIPFKGTWNGRAYDYIAQNYRPDHLAILLDSKGACSIKDGCGVLVNSDSDIRKKLIHPEVRELTDNIFGITKKRVKKAGKFAGGAAIGGASAIGGFKAGAAAGALMAAPIPIPGARIAGGIIGGGIGAALGGYAGRKVARKVGGKTAATGAGVGELAGLVGGGSLALKGAGKLAGKFGGKAGARVASFVAKRTASKAIRKIPSAFAPQTKRAALAMKGRSLAKGVGASGLDMASYVGTGVALERIGRKKQKHRGFVGNAWTEEARRKSAETRKRNKEMRTRALVTGGAVSGGYLAARVAGTVIGRPLSKAVEPQNIKTSVETLHRAVKKSLADPDAAIRHGFVKPKPGLGRRTLRLLSKIRRFKLK